MLYISYQIYNAGLISYIKIHKHEIKQPKNVYL